MSEEWDSKVAKWRREYDDRAARRRIFYAAQCGRDEDRYTNPTLLESSEPEIDAEEEALDGRNYFEMAYMQAKRFKEKIAILKQTLKKLMHCPRCGCKLID